MSVNRRHFLVGAGALATAPFLPSVGLAAPTCAVDNATHFRILDASKDLTKKAKLLKDAGIDTVIRFYSRDAKHLFKGKRYQNTVLSTEELKALQDHDIAVATVFQYFSGGSGSFFFDSPGNAYYDKNKKINDVYCAVNSADGFKQPEGSTIYFGADFDLGKAKTKATLENRVSTIKSYFEHAQREVTKSGRKVGIYGCGKTCEILQKEGWDMHYWLSASTSYWKTAEFYNVGDWHLFQTKTDVHGPLGEIDTNILNPKFSYFGQWKGDKTELAEPRETAEKIFDARRYAVHSRTDLFSDPSLSNRALLPQKGRAGLPVRIICQVGAAVGINLSEKDGVDAYCKTSDLGPRIPLNPAYQTPLYKDFDH